MRKIDVLDVIKKLRSVAQRAQKIDTDSVELGQRVLENRIMVLEGYLNFLDQEGLPSLKKIVGEMDELGEKVYIGGSNDD